MAKFVIAQTTKIQPITNIKIMKLYPCKKAQAYETPQAECLDLRTDCAFLVISGGEPESISEDNVDLDFNY